MSKVVIFKEDGLLRRLIPFGLNPDGSVNSAAFKKRKKPKNKFSVDLEKLTTLKKCLGNLASKGFAVGRFKAAIPISLGFRVHHDPEYDNYAHTTAEGHNNDDKCRALARATEVLLRPAQHQAV